MDPPLVNESSFSAANPSSYSLAEIWPFQGINVEAGAAGLGLRVGNLASAIGFGIGHPDGSAEESSVTDHSVAAAGNARKRRDFSSEDESSRMVSTTSSGNELNDSKNKRMKQSGSRNETGNSGAEPNSTANNAAVDQSKPSEPPKQDFIHVRARRGQATDSHSLAERARREKISERMKLLQDLVPGCNKIIGKALVLDEIINYVQSLQRQVEFLSMKLETVNARMGMNTAMEGFHLKDLGGHPFDATGMMFGQQATREYVQGPQAEWLHMQVGGGFERSS
ncbi:unnamed protein product [Linum tenue]|uniref:BHLH domain-containing protein n=1 Tax=Linum tenue TaxID=586396 RepID=A0AAV0INY8_9ROSI|nr:unnamed protein product [Linum tenue]